MPEGKDKFGEFVDDPLVVPKVNVLATVMLLVNPPVPDTVKLVASVILNTVVSAVV